MNREWEGTAKNLPLQLAEEGGEGHVAGMPITRTDQRDEDGRHDHVALGDDLLDHTIIAYRAIRS